MLAYFSPIVSCVAIIICQAYNLIEINNVKALVIWVLALWILVFEFRVLVVFGEKEKVLHKKNATPCKFA